MRGYSGIDMPLSACLHFVRNSEIDDATSDIFASAREKNITVVYVDFLGDFVRKSGILQCIAAQLNLDSQPYRRDDHLPFWDDLISLAYKKFGLVIVLDNAADFLATAPTEFFDLIEAFMVQFNHWFKLNKPCHLCFQMEKNPLIAELLADQ